MTKSQGKTLAGLGLAALVAAALVCIGAGAATAGAPARAHAAYAQQCASSDTSPQNPSNPLDTPGVTGGNPLTRAHLFVESPWQFGGSAADAIAQLVGLSSLSHQERGRPLPWATFRARVNRMRLSRTVAYRVRELEKIGDYPQSHRFSPYTAGGSGSGVYTEVQHYLCRMQRTDPHATAVITTYFLAHHGCTSGYQPNFQAEVDGLKAAVGNFSALIYVEEDAIDTICWKSAAAVQGREALLKYEIDQLSQLPHALLYVEGGTADANSAADSARVLNASDARKTRGFFLGDTHFNWAYREIQFGNAVARRTGLHFLVDSRADGQGPVRNPDPVRQGNERLCNPPRRGLGPPPGVSDGRAYGMYSRYLDGFVWVNAPGASAAATCPGYPGHWAASGTFDPNIAVDLAHRANARLGPSPPFRSRPW